MKREIKKITLENGPKTKTPKQNAIKKLASEPTVIEDFVKEKMNSMKKNDLKSWFVPSFLKKEVQKHPVKIEEIIKDIQKHRKTNQLHSKKQSKDIKKTKPISNPSPILSTESSKKNKEIPSVKRQKGGRVKTRKEGRLYSNQELKDLYKSLVQLYKDGNNSKITSILGKLTKNQCNQILNYKKLIKKSWTNAPLPLLRFLVYQLISYPNLRYRIL